MSLDSLIPRENIFFKQRIQLHHAHGLGAAVEMVGADAMKQISRISAFYVTPWRGMDAFVTAVVSLSEFNCPLKVFSLHLSP